MAKLKEYVWDKLFLDFYLDKHWTLEFKILNLISGDFLRPVITMLHYHLQDNITMDPNGLRCRRAKFWADAAWHAWRK